MKIKNYKSKTLFIPHFEAGPAQAWCIIGANRSGIEEFFGLLAGEIRPDQDQEIHRPKDCTVLSFAGQQALFEAELKNNDTDFMDRIDPGTPAREFLNSPESHQDLIQAFAMDKVMDHGFRQLSTGQSRKLLLLASLTRGTSCLIIQAPYDGLDTAGCRELDRALTLCQDRGILIIITVHNPEDIPLWATHIGLMDQGRLALSGTRQKVLKDLPASMGQADFKANANELAGDRPDPYLQKQELVRLEKGSASYQGSRVFTGLDLKIGTQDHTLISGPNGCGKSTLLQIITGDHPACYQNRLWIFGTRRGTGESIWNLKKDMGIVSADLHRNYIVPGSVLDCVLSGLFDSIGLYTVPSSEDKKKAMAWLNRISFSHEAATPLRRLSYADQRLVLIARALIKLPALLILDEPTQGLDRANREAILDFLEQVAKENLSTILYVSHREDEFRDFFVFHLKMGSSIIPV